MHFVPALVSTIREFRKIQMTGPDLKTGHLGSRQEPAVCAKHSGRIDGIHAMAEFSADGLALLVIEVKLEAGIKDPACSFRTALLTFPLA